MKKSYITIIALSALLFSCGPDPELVASGVSHTCAIKDLQKKLEEDPTNEELQRDLKNRAEYLESVINTADEGDRAALEDAIKEASKNCN
ncbi:MAG: hypothetical protein EP338_12155 [Bacteroidetes bacterium]|nr:MAG: hypothetical protein EP338_12155 [Bacteroidota bacterium]